MVEPRRCAHQVDEHNAEHVRGYNNGQQEDALEEAETAVRNESDKG